MFTVDFDTQLNREINDYCNEPDNPFEDIVCDCPCKCDEQPEWKIETEWDEGKKYYYPKITNGEMYKGKWTCPECLSHCFECGREECNCDK